ncbi:MAG: IS200/IS605 family accessory protein TnpB-related protein [Clostridiales bacterium]|nr:IS200/IS605 family accessory protein TnpB-related protein [Clostridiales bacterium]
MLSFYETRNKQINHLLHSATKEITNYCKVNNISKVIIGDIKNIRKNANHGKINNQKLHKFSFAKIYDLLSYKLKLQGIEFIKQNEAYSSQCSPLSLEVSKTYAEKSNRKHRGLYKDGDFIFNADSVGAFNIMRLYHQKNKLNYKTKAIGLNNPTTYKFNQNSKYLCNASRGVAVVA